MFYSQDEFCFVSDGDTRLLVYPNAVSRGPYVGIIWSEKIFYKGFVAFDFDELLATRIEVLHTYHDREHLRCLLYTSPSPRDRQKSRMPSSA